jgi:hypothetical protein
LRPRDDDHAIHHQVAGADLHIHVQWDDGDISQTTPEQRTMTNTERLIADFEEAEKHNALPLRFMVGRNTGNAPSVIAALRRRGFVVEGVNGKYEVKGRVYDVEGWALIENTGTGFLEIQRDDEMGRFESDDDAVAHVKHMASQGSVFHQEALSKHMSEASA